MSAVFASRREVGSGGELVISDVLKGVIISTTSGAGDEIDSRGKRRNTFVLLKGNNPAPRHPESMFCCVIAIFHASAYALTHSALCI